uniref:Leucine rich repeat containing 40 n=1 Tax=Sphaeramia orbicularis TaxID=375764 RepID=A0A673CQN4_9TELE
MSRFKKTAKVDSLAGFRTEKTEPVVPNGLINAARKSGQLNLSGRGLTEVPQNVYRLNIDTPEEAQQNVSFGASDRWWEQTDLTKLLLSSNQLTHLSDDIRLLPALTTLDVSNMMPCAVFYPLTNTNTTCIAHTRSDIFKLTSVPVEVCTLKNLRSLTLQQNQMESLPEELGQLENLTELDVSNNHLTALPSTLGHLSCLQKLNLNHNKLSSLPDSLAQLKNVKLLDCSNNQLTDIPVSLSEMLALEQLYLRHNKLRLLPQLPAPSLKELYVGNNQIEQLEAEQLSSLTAISLLELRDNKIKSLPEQITLLSTLTRLDLTNNDITTLPASLGLLPNLKMLLLEGNPMRGIRRDLLTVSETQTTLVFVFSEKQADQVPDEVFDAAADQAISNVNFSKNRLSNIPPRLMEFHSSVSDINLGFNRLTCCSPDVCKLLQLMHIDFRNNQLSDLPSEMRNLTKLRSIILNYNRFKTFPDILYEVVSLETVLLGNNQVGGVDPGRLIKLVNLSTLDLSNNDLLNIPPELGLCTTLRCLSLEGNPFRTPRAAIVAKGTDAVLEYLRSRIPT